MTDNRLEEGDRCPECGEGILEYGPVENCTCFIVPPCAACVNNPLTCTECGWEEEPPE